MRTRLCEPTAERRRLGWMLEREGVKANLKKVCRPYREEGLAVRRRRGGRRALTTEFPPQARTWHPMSVKLVIERRHRRREDRPLRPFPRSAQCSTRRSAARRDRSAGGFSPPPWRYVRGCRWGRRVPLLSNRFFGAVRRTRRGVIPVQSGAELPRQSQNASAAPTRANRLQRRGKGRFQKMRETGHLRLQILDSVSDLHRIFEP